MRIVWKETYENYTFLFGVETPAISRSFEIRFWLIMVFRPSWTELKFVEIQGWIEGDARMAPLVNSCIRERQIYSSNLNAGAKYVLFSFIMLNFRCGCSYILNRILHIISTATHEHRFTVETLASLNLANCNVVKDSFQCKPCQL